MEQGFKDNYFRDEGPYTICCICCPGISVTPFEPPNAPSDHHTQMVDYKPYSKASLEDLV